MLKKTIKFKDFNNVEREETFYFNLTKAEIAKMSLAGLREVNGQVEMDNEVGFGASLQKIIKSNSGQLIIDTFEEIIAASYGVKSEDGRTFRKSPELFADFKASAAYDVFFMEIVTNADAGARFIRAIVPEDIASQVTGNRPVPQDHQTKDES